MDIKEKDTSSNLDIEDFGEVVLTAPKAKHDWQVQKIFTANFKQSLEAVEGR